MELAPTGPGGLVKLGGDVLLALAHRIEVAAQLFAHPLGVVVPLIPSRHAGRG